MDKRCAVFILCLAACLGGLSRWFTAPLQAQTASATINGRISDPQGSIVPGVEVRAINTDTNVEYPARTNDAGIYVIPDLPPGRYRMVVRKEGFKEINQMDLVLHVQDTIEQNFALEMGSVSQSVTVAGEAPLVETNATENTLVVARSISDLPINGRNAFALVTQAAGVKSEAGLTNSSGFNDRGTALSAISINGGPNSVNNFVIDGTTDNEVYVNETSTMPTVDAIEEFKIEYGVLPAQFGTTAGGIVNVVTKSGTNTLHGDAYEFFRNNVLDARNAFATTVAPLHYNQYGVSVGGPVFFPKLYNGKDRTFFFFNFEGWQYATNTNPITTVPTQAERNGDFSADLTATGKLIPIYDPASVVSNPSGSGYISQPFSGNIIPQGRLDKAALSYLQFFPSPNLTPSNSYTNANNFMANDAWQSSMKQFVARIDHQISQKQNLFGRFLYYREYTDAGVAGIPLPDPLVRCRYDTFKAPNFNLTDTYTFSPTFINQFQFGIDRQHFPFQSASYNGNWPAKLGLPSSIPPDVIPTVSIANWTTIPSTTVGLRATTTWQFLDTLNIVRGAHMLTAGTDIRIMQANNLQRGNPSGSFTFPQNLTGNPQSPSGTGDGLATFFLGAVGSASITTYEGETEQGYMTAFFIQDDWKAARRLTLNLGLRYDFQPWAVERHRGQSNWIPNATDSVNGLRGALEFAGVNYGVTALQNIHDNFGPRVGFAYDLTGHGTTVFRGGYAIMYPLIFYRDMFGDTAGFANTSTSYSPAGNNTNIPAFQFSSGFPSAPLEPLGKALGPAGFLGQSVSYDQPNGKVPMSQQWGASLEQQLGRGWLLKAGYTGNHVTHMIAGSYQLDQLPVSDLSLGLQLQNQVANPYAGIVPGSLGGKTISLQQSLLPYPYYSSVTVRDPHEANSIYHALVVTIQKRYSTGLTLLGSYTAGKLIATTMVTPINFGNVSEVGVTGIQDPFDRKLERAVDPTDVSQRLVSSGIYELPFGAGRRWAIGNRPLNGLVGGWQVDGILTMQTGVPLAITGASNYLATRPNLVGNAKLSNRTIKEWFNTSVFVNPPNYTFGTTGMTLPNVRGPGAVVLDLSLVKNTTIKENLKLQFRVEAFNAPNHVNLGLPNMSFVAGTNGLNASSSFGQITSASDPRIYQFALKLIF